MKCSGRNKSYSKFKAYKKFKNEENMNYLDTAVSPSLLKYDNTPHILMELSQDEFATLKHCCIHVTDISFNKSKSSSQKTIETRFHSIAIGKVIQYHRNANIVTLNMERSQHKMVLITENKEE